VPARLPRVCVLTRDFFLGLKRSATLESRQREIRTCARRPSAGHRPDRNSPARGCLPEL